MKRQTLAFALTTLAALLVVGCSESNESPPAASAPLATVQPTATATPAPPATPASSATPKPPEVYRGVNLSPRSFGAEDYTRFFDEARQAGNIISWSGPWPQIADLQRGPPSTIAQFAAQKGLNFMIQSGYPVKRDVQSPRISDEATKASFLASLKSYVERHKPKYVAFGVEINNYDADRRDVFDELVALFPAVADAVHAASPSTRVMTIFQLEIMKGLRGGLFGGKNDPAAAQWDLLNLFPRADALGFTTYPSIIFKDPSEMPADYYTEIAKYTQKPVVFTEIGWFASAAIPDWESSEAEQAAFVARFREMVAPLNPQLMLYSFLYDPSSAGLPLVFDKVGLMRLDGTPRPALEAWRRS
jgi:hypothetical protein